MVIGRRRRGHTTSEMGVPLLAGVGGALQDVDSGEQDEEVVGEHGFGAEGCGVHVRDTQEAFLIFKESDRALCAGED